MEGHTDANEIRGEHFGEKGGNGKSSEGTGASLNTEAESRIYCAANQKDLTMRGARAVLVTHTKTSQKKLEFAEGREPECRKNQRHHFGTRLRAS